MEPRRSNGAVPDLSGRRPSVGQVTLVDAAGGRRPSYTVQGMKIDHVEMPYTPAETDHQKAKPLDYCGPAYEFSSPFAFSQGDATGADVSSAGGQINIHINVGPGSAPQPYGEMSVASSSVQVQESTNTTTGFQQQTTSAHYRPPPGQQYGSYPQQYQQGGFYPPGPQQPYPPQQQPYPQPGYAGPPPSYQQYPPQSGGVRPATLEGWLSKRSDGGIASVWNMRWWKLGDGVMAYSRDEKGMEAGRIQLNAKTEVRPIAHPSASVEGRMMAPKKPHAFEIYQGVGLRTYYLDAGSAQKRDLWLSTLQAAIAQFRQSAWPHGAPPGGFGPGGY